MITKGSVLCFLLALAASTHATETGEDKEIPLLDMLPIAAQIKSLVQLIEGDLNGSVQTGYNFYEMGIGAAQLHSMYQLITGNVGKAVEIQKEFVRNLVGKKDSPPITRDWKHVINLKNVRFGTQTGQVVADHNRDAKPNGLVDYVVTLKDRKVDAVSGVIPRVIADGAVKAHGKQGEMQPFNMKLVRSRAYAPADAAQTLSDVPDAKQ